MLFAVGARSRNGYLYAVLCILVIGPVLRFWFHPEQTSILGCHWLWLPVGMGDPSAIRQTDPAPLQRDFNFGLGRSDSCLFSRAIVVSVHRSLRVHDHVLSVADLRLRHALLLYRLVSTIRALEARRHFFSVRVISDLHLAPGSDLASDEQPRPPRNGVRPRRPGADLLVWIGLHNSYRR